MTEVEFIQSRLAQSREEITKLPEQFQALKRAADRNIDMLCEEAGIMGAVQQVRTNLEANQKRVQTQADLLTGRVGGLEEILNEFYLAPIPEGMTHMYGIELAAVDPMTRLKVMGGQEGDSWRATIEALGGDPDHPDWDGTYEEDDEEDDEEEESEEDESDPVLPSPPVAHTAMVQPMPPGIDYAMFEGTDLVGIITGESEPEGEPEDGDLDDIELAEIESRIEDDTATQEDLERVALMLSRARQGAEE